MKYGTLINGEPVIAPNPLHINGRMVYNPSGNIYVNVGYTPIIDTAMPETGVRKSITYPIGRSGTVR